MIYNNYSILDNSEDQSVSISAYYGTESVVEIPSSINERTVVRITPGAFKRNNRIQHLIIPESITEIGMEAFSGCLNLSEIELKGNSVPKIGEGAFSATEWLNAQRGSLIILNQRILIGSRISLRTIQIPAEIQSIADSAFKSNIRLQNILFPHGLRKIGAMAFQECRNLLDMEFPDSIEEIGTAAFAGCTHLQKIALPEKLTQITPELFLGCSSLSEMMIPISVISIQNNAFFSCSSLQKIEIPESVVDISPDAFDNCSLTVLFKSSQAVVWLEGTRQTNCFRSGAFPFDLAAYDQNFDHFSENGQFFAAMNRLLHPVDLSLENQKKYESFLKYYPAQAMDFAVTQANPEEFKKMADAGIIGVNEENAVHMILKSERSGNTVLAEYLLKHYGQSLGMVDQTVFSAREWKPEISSAADLSAAANQTTEGENQIRSKPILFEQEIQSGEKKPDLPSETNIPENQPEKKNDLSDQAQ